MSRISIQDLPTKQPFESGIHAAGRITGGNVLDGTSNTFAIREPYTRPSGFGDAQRLEFLRLLQVPAR